jgi:hypothetical protein
MKNENRERGEAHRSLAGGGGTTASVQRKIRSLSNVAERSGGVVDDDAGRRQAEAPAYRWATAAAFLLGSLVRRRSARGRGSEEDEDCVGVKRASYPHPVFIPRRPVVGVVGSVPLPRPFLR